MPYLVRLYLSPRGRVGRFSFLAYFAIPFILLGILVGFFSSRDPRAALATLIAISAVSLWPSFAMTIKRLHDLSLSGWWVLAWYVVFGGLVLLRVPYLGVIVQLASLVVMVLLVALPGTNGANKYGAKP